MNIKKNFVIAFALGAIVFAFSAVAFGQTPIKACALCAAFRVK